jgi:ribosome-associated protein
LDLARAIVTALEEKKGENILLMDIHEIASFTDYFIICNGTSDRMLDALARDVVESAEGLTEDHYRVEGRSSDGWLLVDLGDVVVHLFSPDQRNYYRLEQLWDKGKILIKMQ